MAKKTPIVQATFYNNNTKQIENCYPMTSAKGVIMSDGKTLEESFSDKANDTNVIHKSGDEEILGRKTFDDLRANGFCLSDEGDWNRWVSAFYSFLENKGIIQFGTEEDWSVILRNIADPEYDYDAATKGYVDIKIGDASIPVLQYGVLINNDLPSILESKEQAIANAPIYAKILSGEVKFFAAKAGNDLFISSKIQITNGQANVTLLGLKVPSLTLHIVQMTIGQSGLSSKINLWMNLQSALSDTDGGYGQRVVELEKGKANIQHQHTVADITDFPELYYDATAFFTSGAYPSDKYEELLEAVKAKRTVYATIDEAGYTSYIFFVSSANSDGSSSRVLLTTIFADGSYLYLNTFVLQQTGMTPLQESITGKADKATTLAGYGIGDAYTKSELDALLKGKQSILTAGNGISIEGNEIGVTTITESESQPNSSLWINPSEDTETDVTYNRSQIDAMLGAKQDALQLTVKDNGNIVLSNIQGQSKEFMPATPSGDPMHYAYEAAGAVYNGTGADITRIGRMTGDTIIHKAGYWYLNELGDISNEEMRQILIQGRNSDYLQCYTASVASSLPLRTNLFPTKAPGSLNWLNIEVVVLLGNPEVRDYTVSTNYKTIYTNKVVCRKILTIIDSKVFAISKGYTMNRLEFFKLKNMALSQYIGSPYFREDCVLYMIQNEAATSAITITLHADAYTRAMANADIVAALESHPNVSLASA